MAFEFDLGEALDFCDRHKVAHPEPTEGCPYCARALLDREINADLEKELGRRPTRAEFDADPRAIAYSAQLEYDLARFAQAFRSPQEK
jgi:hypothetical protein